MRICVFVFVWGLVSGSPNLLTEINSLQQDINNLEQRPLHFHHRYSLQQEEELTCDQCNPQSTYGIIGSENEYRQCVFGVNSAEVCPASGFFDAHNHWTGVWHWVAYAMGSLAGLNHLLERKDDILRMIHGLFGSDVANNADCVLGGLFNPNVRCFDLYVYQYLSVGAMSNGEVVFKKGDDELGEYETFLGALEEAFVGMVLERVESRDLARSLQSDPRVSGNSNTAGDVLACIDQCSTVACKKNVLTSTLTASRLTDFDSAYAARGKVEGAFSSQNQELCGTEVDFQNSWVCTSQGGTYAAYLTSVYRYGVDHLIFSGVKYVELSSPAWLPFPGMNCGSIGVNWLQSMCYAIANEALWERALINGVTVRWLPMFMSYVFGLDDWDETPETNDAFRGRVQNQGCSRTEKAGVCKPDSPTEPSTPFTPVGNHGPVVLPGASDPWGETGQHWRKVFDELLEITVPAPNPEGGDPLQVRMVAGVDFASPEKSLVAADYDSVGIKSLRYMLKDMYARAKAKGVRLLFHIHLGEGFQYFNSHRIDGIWKPRREANDPIRANGGWGTVQSKLCFEAVKEYGLQIPIPLMQIRDGSSYKPVHTITGRNNIATMNGHIDAFRRELGEAGTLNDFDKHVVLRYGHATHADRTGAANMKRLKIDADVCLSSNIATRALGGLHWSNGDYLEIGSNSTALPSSHSQNEFHYASSPNITQYFRMVNSGPQGAVAEMVAGWLSDHSVMNLLQEGVNIYLGSDGPGVEHSSHAQDIDMLSRATGNVANMLQSQSTYVNEMMAMAS